MCVLERKPAAAAVAVAAIVGFEPPSHVSQCCSKGEGGVCVCYAMCVFCFAVGYLTQSVTNIHRQVTLCSIATRQTEEERERESENL